MIINDYKNWLTNVRKFSNSTVDTYIRAVNFFNDFLIEFRWWRTIEPVGQITMNDYEDFVEHETDTKDPRTVNNYTAWIKCFLKFCLNKWYNVLNPQRLICQRELDKKIDSLDTIERQRLIDVFKWVSACSERQKLIKARDLCIVILLLSTGLRVTELATLKKSDVTWNQVQIIGKWWKRRVVTIFNEHLILLKNYLSMRTDWSPYVFISHAHNTEWKPISRNSIEKIIKKGGEKAWISTKVFPHKLRHTFATELLRNNADLFYIQQLLGHKNFSTTQTYLTALNPKAEENQKKIEYLFR